VAQCLPQVKYTPVLCDSFTELCDAICALCDAVVALCDAIAGLYGATAVLCDDVLVFCDALLCFDALDFCVLLSPSYHRRPHWNHAISGRYMNEL
jgi:hypothetical protein